MNGLLVKGVTMGEDIIVWSSRKLMGWKRKIMCLLKPGQPGQEKQPLVRKGVRSRGLFVALE